MSAWTRQSPAAVIFHITTAVAWEAALREGEYRPPSLASEGFIHCSRGRQLDGVLERFFEGQRGLIALEIDPDRVEAEVRYDGVDGDAFPHIYGALNLDAVVGLRRLAGEMPPR